MIHKAAEAAKKFGPKSSKKFGNCFNYCSTSENLKNAADFSLLACVVLKRLGNATQDVQSVAQHRISSWRGRNGT